jgi:hypothetical protein
MSEFVQIVLWLLFCAGVSWLMRRQRRNTLLNVRYELGKLRWIGADDGWDKAIEAVRAHLLEQSKLPPNTISVKPTKRSRPTTPSPGSDHE